MNCWRLRMDRKLGDPVIGEPPYLCEFYFLELHQVLTGNIRHKSLMLMAGGGGKELLWNMPEILLFLAIAAPRNLFNQSLNNPKEGKYPTSALSSILVPPQGGTPLPKLRSMCEFHSLEISQCRLTRVLLPEGFPSPTPDRHIARGLFTAVPFTQYILSGYEEKIISHPKRQNTQF